MATQQAMDLRQWRGMSAEGAAKPWETGTQVVVRGKEADEHPIRGPHSADVFLPSTYTLPHIRNSE